MRPILIASLVSAVLLHGSRPCDGATPPDPMDPTALDVVLTGTERLCARQIVALRLETTRVWSQSALVLDWPDRPRPPRAYVLAHIDWTPGDYAGASQASLPLGWIQFVDGLPANRTIVVSGAAAADLSRRVVLGSRPMNELPAALRDGLLVRMLARALAHEIGHYILGPAHADRGLMQARFSIAQLIDPSPARYRLSAHQVALVGTQASTGSAPEGRRDASDRRAEARGLPGMKSGH